MKLLLFAKTLQLLTTTTSVIYIASNYKIYCQQDTSFLTLYWPITAN